MPDGGSRWLTQPSRIVAASAALAIVGGRVLRHAARPAARPASPAATQRRLGGHHARGQTYRCTKGDGQLNGAGATFLYPLYSKMGRATTTPSAASRSTTSRSAPAAASSSGQQNTVDFGASDAFLKDSRDRRPPPPTARPSRSRSTFGAVVVAYNLHGPLGADQDDRGRHRRHLRPARSRRWNDAAIADREPGPEPAGHRDQRRPSLGRLGHDQHLHDVPDQGQPGLGRRRRRRAIPTKSAGKTVEWPVGIGASGNEGVTQGITQTEGAVGYIELAYALENKIAFADVKNKSGNFIRPSLESVIGRGQPARATRPTSASTWPTRRPRQATRSPARPGSSCTRTCRRS